MMYDGLLSDATNAKRVGSADELLTRGKTRGFCGVWVATEQNPLPRAAAPWMKFAE